MQKRIVPKAQQQPPQFPDEGWLDLERIADVELTSEDSAHPIESALLPIGGSGWRAAQAGEQTIRVPSKNVVRVALQGFASIAATYSQQL